MEHGGKGVRTVTADGLAPFGAKGSTGTVMIAFGRSMHKYLMVTILPYSPGSLGVLFTITPQEELTALLTTQLASSVGAAMDGATFILPDNTVAPVTGGTLFIQREIGDISNRKFAHLEDKHSTVQCIKIVQVFISCWQNMSFFIALSIRVFYRTVTYHTPLFAFKDQLIE